VRELAAHGLGVALMARSAAQGPGSPVAVHGVHPEMRRAVALIHRADRTLPAAADAFRSEVLRRHR
jgi:DNA-binding transcriptional LysR family regulator